VHLCFVHRATQPSTRSIPEMRTERTDDGVAMYARRGDAPERRVHYWFPHMVEIPLFPIPGEPVVCPFFNWKTPIDDGHTLFIAAAAVPEELADRINDDEIGGRTMEPDAAAELMMGIRRPKSVTEEDYVAMVGQGMFADRSNERLGSSDIGVIEVRRLWREALADVTGETSGRSARTTAASLPS
jgi:5,5'-dehydrodivanillate O-demethylase